MRRKVGLERELECNLVVAESLCGLLLSRKEFLQQKLKKINFNPALFHSYRKIPKIIPGAYNVQKCFLIEGLIYGWKFASQNRLGLYLQQNLYFTINWASL